MYCPLISGRGFNILGRVPLFRDRHFPIRVIPMIMGKGSNIMGLRPNISGNSPNILGSTEIPKYPGIHGPGMLKNKETSWKSF